MTRARSTAGVSLHSGKAAAAALTARLTSSAEQSGTRAITRPVEGFHTSAWRSLVEVRVRPSIKTGTSVAGTRSLNAVEGMANRSRISFYVERFEQGFFAENRSKNRLSRFSVGVSWTVVGMVSACQLEYTVYPLDLSVGRAVQWLELFAAA